MISLRGLLYYTIEYLTIGIFMEFLTFFRIISSALFVYNKISNVICIVADDIALNT